MQATFESPRLIAGTGVCRIAGGVLVAISGGRWRIDWPRTNRGALGIYLVMVVLVPIAFLVPAALVFLPPLMPLTPAPLPRTLCNSRRSWFACLLWRPCFSIASWSSCSA